MHIKTLIFDLDDTLVVERASAERAIMATCDIAAKNRKVDPNDLYQTIWREARRLWHKSPARSYSISIGISSWEALWARFDGEDENLKILRSWSPTYSKQAWHNALLKCGVDDPEFALYLSEEFKKQRRKICDVYSDIVPNLSKLKEAYILALVTNGAPDLQREKILCSGLAKYFKEIVISGEVGFGKPNPEIFNIALKRIGIKPDQVIMAGNNLETDIKGANGAGIKSVWLNRKKEKNESNIKPDYEINNIGELQNILDNLE
jgi:putative hydrolase of the HAD superfamily